MKSLFLGLPAIFSMQERHNLPESPGLYRLAIIAIAASP
jgi:hypothetical protein